MKQGKVILRGCDHWEKQLHVYVVFRRPWRSAGEMKREKRLSRKKRGSQTAPQRLARGSPKTELKMGCSTASRRAGLVTAAPTMLYFVLCITLFLNPLVYACLNLCCNTSKRTYSSLYTKTSVVCDRSVLWSSRSLGGHLPQETQHSATGKAKFHLQKFLKLSKINLHHTVNRQCLVPLLKYSQIHQHA